MEGHTTFAYRLQQCQYVIYNNNYTNNNNNNN